jgi:hypothetical protein
MVTGIQSAPFFQNKIQYENTHNKLFYFVLLGDTPPPLHRGVCEALSPPLVVFLNSIKRLLLVIETVAFCEGGIKVVSVMWMNRLQRVE